MTKNKAISETALGNWHIDHSENGRLNNKIYWFAAYRQYIGWIHGRLGQNKRKPVPDMFKKHRQICSIPKNAKKFFLNVINITMMDTKSFFECYKYYYDGHKKFF